MSEKWDVKFELTKTQIITDIQNRIREVDALDELFNEVDLEVYNEEIER
jgi:hypothetical protein